MRKSLIAMLILLPFMANAQTTDDFSDGDFTDNPTWVGTTADFIVNQQYQLQLNASEAGTAYLSVSTGITSEREWRLWFRLNFAPSGSNCCDIYLSSNSSDLTNVAEGYYLHVGETGSNDALELRRKSGSSSTLICRGTDCNMASAFAVSVIVKRDTEGNWTIFTDYTGNGYELETQGTDSTYSMSAHFGFLAKFTSSNKTNFYFDDIYVGTPIVDSEPPQFTGYQIIDENKLKISFNEALDNMSVSTANFVSQLQIDSVSFAENTSNIIVYFADDFADNIENQITVSNITDLAGNTAQPFTITFKYFTITYNSVVINEIMADPTPVVELPNFEYVELFNNTANTINLKNWTLKLGTAEKQLPDFELSGGAYVIVSSESGVVELADYGDCIGLSSISITNGGTTVSLADPNGNIISEVAFTDKWYKDSSKKDGGWSLELINPNDLCTNAENNWTASVSPLGGTPGSINSVFANDVVTPEIEVFEIASVNSIHLSFNQIMDSLSMCDKTNYSISGTNPVSVTAETDNSVLIVSAIEFDAETSNILAVSGVTNCAGLEMEDFFKEFVLPSEPTENQIVINEILYNPISPCVDYVELYNNSNLTFDLNNMCLGVITETFPSPPDTTLRVITNMGYYLEPHRYVLLSSNGEAVAMHYGVDFTANYLDMSSFPSYSNSGGQAILVGADKQIIDKMTFSEKMQYPLLKNTKGVALERVSPDLPSNDASNWHSGSFESKYGTPGYENSVYHKMTETADNVNVEPAVFSPDNDGYNDVCVISVNNSEAATVNVRILNSQGAEMRHLVKSELAGSGCSAVWDGLDNSGNRVQTGIYIIYAEWFLSDGSVRRAKKTVVVASM